jgi:benzoyl-CoA reductase/2-hydroxyglutaryl-CoA dehydratase subunit BcrC/BadD/HgdB
LEESDQVVGQDLASLDKIQNLAERHLEIVARSRKPVMGWFCAYTPLEILMAAGLYPYRIVPEPSRAIALADSYIERSFCPYVRSCLGEALEGRYRFLDGLVVVNSCDPMRRMYDAWRYYIGGDFISLLDLPRINTDLAVAYYRDCLERFIGELEAHYRVKISAAAIADAISAQNRIRSRLRELYQLNQSCGMPVSAVQIQRVVRASTILPEDKFIEMIELLLDEVGRGRFDYQEGPRVLISGSLMENPLIIELIEQSGAKVVGDDLCTGTRQFWQLVEPDNDPITTLSRYYLNRTPCPRMKDAQRRFDHVFQLIDEFRVDGVIFYTLKFCDSFLYDIPVLKGQLGARGIPSLILESDYTPGTLGRVKTRIQAFIEMLGQNVRAA